MTKLTVHILAFGVLAVATGHPRHGGVILRGDNCNRGAAVIGEFYENPCPRGKNNPFEKLPRSEEGRLFGPEPLTVDMFRNYLSKYCSEAMPEARKCFANVTQECPPAQKMYLKKLALDTAEFCEIGGTQLSHWMTYLLDRLTDEDVAYNPKCGYYFVVEECRQQALNVSRMSDYGDDVIQSATVQFLLPIVQRYYKTLFECQVNTTRNDPNHCSDWRMAALMPVLHLTGPTVLGLQLHYTEAQITEMFQLNDRRARAHSRRLTKTMVGDQGTNGQEEGDSAGIGIFAL